MGSEDNVYLSRWVQKIIYVCLDGFRRYLFIYNIFYHIKDSIIISHHFINRLKFLIVRIIISIQFKGVFLGLINLLIFLSLIDSKY